MLGRPAREGGTDGDPAAAQAAFARGLAVAHDSGSAGIAGRLFTARSLFLTGALSAAATLDYLSGLLIGEESRSVLASRRDDPWPPVALIGDAALCSRYRDALATCGIAEGRICGDGAAAGLWQIATAAGLVP
ncbi:MAG: 2-dehydro-3-deoxygalactonokinase [bacterium]